MHEEDVDFENFLRRSWLKCDRRFVHGEETVVFWVARFSFSGSVFVDHREIYCESTPSMLCWSTWISQAEREID